LTETTGKQLSVNRLQATLEGAAGTTATPRVQVHFEKYAEGVR